MNDLTLYPELIDYIYWYCTRFQAATEKLAVKTFTHYWPGMDEKTREMYTRVGWISDEDEVKKIIEGGFEAFKEQVATRIFDQHKDELTLNLCPKCFRIARTPLAKQCRFCFHDWHEPV